MRLFEFINERITGPLIPIALLVCGIYFSVRLKFFHLLHPIKLCRAILKKDGGADGVSPVSALLLALAGTLGVGNIVGVASAISLGGPGAVLWMWVSALAAMLLKYGEIVLSMRHRRYDKSGAPYGGAFFYIKDCFTSLGLSRLGGAVASVFALLCVADALTMGSVIQINAVSHALGGVFSLPRILCGVLAALCLAFILSRGGRAVTRAAELIVPFMSAVYLILSVAVMLSRRGEVAGVFSLILSDALSPESVGGGIFGFLLSRSARLGTMRGLLSNEAGCGTAPIAHAQSSRGSAAAQGILGIAEVFIDTILLCTMTAVVILISYDEVAHLSQDPVMMTVTAYSTVLGEWASAVLGISVLLFGFATVVCWAHYGVSALRYLSRRRRDEALFKALYCAAVIVGSVAAPNSIFTVSDVALGIMTLINLSVLCLMSREICEETEAFLREG